MNCAKCGDPLTLENTRPYCFEQRLCYRCLLTKSRERAWIDHKRAILAISTSCARCGNDDIRVLQINHTDGGGTKERKITHNRAFYTSIINGTRSTNDLNVMCANCQIIFEYECGRRIQPATFLVMNVSPTKANQESPSRPVKGREVCHALVP